MESANRVPFCLPGYSASDRPWVVPVPGLTGFAIISSLLQPLKLISSVVRYAAASAGTCRVWYVSPRVMTAQTIRAILLAIHGNGPDPHGLTGEQVGQARIHRFRLVLYTSRQRCRADDEKLA
jgi:hypothetical protein